MRSDHGYLHILVNDDPVRLCPEVETMILALIDNQEPIRKQGTGTVTLDYVSLRNDVIFSLLRLNFKTKARKIES